MKNFTYSKNRTEKGADLASIISCLLIFILFTFTNGQAQTLPAGFSEVQVATGITEPTIMAASPDGRIFIAQQGGALRVFKNGSLLPTPFITLSVNSSGERGLVGVAFDPDFANNQYIYLYYTVSSGANNRISRFTANGDVAVPGSEVVLLNLSPLGSATNHNGGTMAFGPDGKLYVGVGENAVPSNSQDLDSYLGKILRLNSDGTPAPGNPFSSGATPERRSIWAYGMRNPYTLTFQPGTGKLFVNDVGQNTWEEINDCTAGGGNYGWPSAEGFSSNPAFVNPVYAYMHGSSSGQGCAITGGDFFNPTTTNYPATYTGNYFFMDYCNNWIDRLEISGSTITRTNFASNISGFSLGLLTAPDGNLYFLSRTYNALYKIAYNSGTAPVISTQPQSISVSQGSNASFSVVATGGTPLSYQWSKNGSTISGATNSTYTISNVTTNDAGTYSVIVSNASGSVTSSNATLTVTTSNTPPVATITTPAAGAYYSAGTSISYTGNGLDAEDGALGASAFEWFVVFHHDTHTHPGPTAPDGVTSGSFSIPNTGETATNVFYRLYLVVTDQNGAKDTSYTDILPNTSTITINTNPQGLLITVDGQPFTAPYTFTSVEGMLRNVGTNSPQTLNNALTYKFRSWSQGGSQNQIITTPIADASYTAKFKAVLRFSDNPTGTVNGLSYSYYHGNWNVIPDFTTLTPVSSGSVTNFDLSPRIQNDYFAFHYTGFINITTAGVYTFYTSSDDGSNLYIGNTLVVNNDGAHAAVEASGQIGLSAGLHAITVDFFERAGGELLTVSYKGPGISKQPIPDTELFRDAQSVIVTTVGDAYVRAGIHANNNYGNSGLLYTKNYIGNALYETYLQFDISSFTGVVAASRLRLYGKINNTNNASIPVEVLFVSSNAWEETTITYNNKPAPSGSALATTTLTGTTGVYYEWDITQQIALLRAAGINTISLLVRNVNVTSNSRILFNSKDASVNRPELVISNSPLRIADELAQLSVQDELLYEINIFPQPAQDYFIIEKQDNNLGGVLTLVDIKGSVVQSVTLTADRQQRISTKDLKNGIYFAIIRNEFVSVRKKLIIQR